MKVLFQNRQDVFNLSGGDTIQMLKTKECLEKLGIKIDISLDLNPDLSGYDIVHLFNLTRKETAQQIKNAKKQNKSVVLSPIYWDTREYFSQGKISTSIIHKMYLTLVRTDYFKKRYFNILKIKQREILKKADIILPDTRKQMELIQKKFNIKSDKFHIVPNAVDSSFKDAKPDEFIKNYGYQDFILCVANICLHKNQLALIRALSNTDLTLVLVGKATNPGYLKLCQKEARKAEGKVIFLGALKHEKLQSVYAAAKVHVLASWYDIPGLSSLEAALSGCNIVSTNRGTASEYFGRFAFYCDPNNIESIRSAVLRAYKAPRNSMLKKLILENYTWEKIAQETLRVYLKLLKK